MAAPLPNWKISNCNCRPALMRRAPNCRRFARPTISSAWSGARTAASPSSGLNDSLNNRSPYRRTRAQDGSRRGDRARRNRGPERAEGGDRQTAARRAAWTVRLAELRQRYTGLYRSRPGAQESARRTAFDGRRTRACDAARTHDSQRRGTAGSRGGACRWRRWSSSLPSTNAMCSCSTTGSKEFKALDGKSRPARYAARRQPAAAGADPGQQLQEVPPIQVVEWARVPVRPIYPDYERDPLIAIAAALDWRCS